jgi:hypothetical protein
VYSGLRLDWIAAVGEIWNYGIAVSQDQSFLAIRVEASAEPPTPLAWVAFYAGQTRPFLRSAGSNGYDGSTEARPWASIGPPATG